jgi:hypothetical protein
MAKGWFKIKKDSPTGQRLREVFDRVERFNIEYHEFKAKYNIKSVKLSSYFLADVESVAFNDTFDSSMWKPVSKKGKYYVPIKGTEADKDLLKLKAIAVKRAEIDVALGAPTLFPEAGFDVRFKDWYFVHFGQGSTYKLSEDCIPITDKEYRKAERGGRFKG